jgi:hypothetical protein
MVRLPLVVTSLAILALAVGASCQSERRAGGIALTGAGASGGGFQPSTGGGPCVIDGDCGNDVHAISFDVPNIYFVFDRSGSMAEAAAESSGDTRYQVVRGAAIDLVRSLGPLINVGAALFPHGDIAGDPCRDGGEVMPVQAGDPIGEMGASGPTTKAFSLSTNVKPNGGTPIAATMDKLRPTLASLGGRTFALLLTDGGPNCNAAALCSAQECMPTIEGDPNCPSTVNCCAPGMSYAGPEMCLDRAPTVAAVQAIADAGVTVYVIGIPGSEAYHQVLDEMAVAGAAPLQSGPTQYHAVDDLATLGALFSQIAAEAISCTFALSDPPADKGFTNVYLDCEAVPNDPVDGWDWLGDDAVELHGAACAKLKSGQVKQVQVASGCPTEVPN